MSRTSLRSPLRAPLLVGTALAALPLLAGTAAAATGTAPRPDARPVAHAGHPATHTASTAHLSAGERARAADARMVAPVAGALRRLRGCESGGNYRTATGNGYYGAYQFDLGTWRAMGYAGVPSAAAPATQDAAAAKLHARRGWGPWPVCSRRLGLR